MSSDDQKKNAANTPEDNTSALFVSARKKQLEQQEAERRAKEKEDERRKAEEEVQRLEAEVAERKRKAEEEARRVAQEEEQRRQEEAKRRQEEAQRRQQEELRRQQEEKLAKDKPPVAVEPAKPSYTAPAASPAPAKAAKAPIKLPLPLPVLIGGGAGLVVLIVAIIVIATLVGSGSKISEEAMAYQEDMLYTQSVWAQYTTSDPQYLITYGDSSWELLDSEYYLIDFGTLEINGKNKLTAYSEHADSPYTDYSMKFTEDLSLEMASEDATVEFYYFTNDPADLYPQNEDIEEEPQYEPQGDPEEDVNVVEPVQVTGSENLNANVIIDGMGMIAYFPDNVLYLDSISDSRMVLKALDNSFTVEIGKLAVYDKLYSDKQTSNTEKRIERLSVSLPNVTEISEITKIELRGGFTFDYGVVNYETDGEERMVNVIVGAWNNVRNGEKFFFEYTFDVAADADEDLAELLLRIHASIEDA